MRPMAVLLAMGLGAFPACAWATTVYLFGQVGDRPVFASIDRDGKELSGWYVYDAVGKSLQLKGTVESSGAFVLDESPSEHAPDSHGGKTGRFTGTVKGNDWSGTWSKPDGTGPRAFSLSESRDGLAAATGKFHCEVKDSVVSGTGENTLRGRLEYSFDIELAKGEVKDFQAAYNGKYSDHNDQSCAIGMEDLVRVKSDNGIVLQTRSDDPPHGPVPGCTIRILGTAGTLYVGMGDATSKDDNVCRQSEDRMFCSPQAWWPDLLLDRRTLKCKTVG